MYLLETKWLILETLKVLDFVSRCWLLTFPCDIQLQKEPSIFIRDCGYHIQF